MTRMMIDDQCRPGCPGRRRAVEFGSLVRGMPIRRRVDSLGKLRLMAADPEASSRCAAPVEATLSLPTLLQSHPLVW